MKGDKGNEGWKEVVTRLWKSLNAIHRSVSCWQQTVKFFSNDERGLRLLIWHQEVEKDGTRDKSWLTIIVIPTHLYSN